jgi:hypothetical protein
MPAMLRTIVFVALIASVSASESLNALINASAGFAVAIVQQLAVVQGEQSPAVFAEKTVSYARAKTAYFNALRDAVPELMAIATGKEARSPEVDRFAESFSVAGEKQKKAADDGTAVLLKQLSFDPDVLKRPRRNSTGRKQSKRNSIMILMVDFTKR